MKILSISPKVPIPANDGGKLSIFGVLKTLSKMGHEIDFIAYLKDTNYDFAKRELKKYCNPILLNVQTENSYWGMLKNLFSPIPYNISKYHRKELTESVRKYFKTNAPDIVHVTNLHMAWIVDEIRKLSDVPVVLRQENFETNIMKRYYENENNTLIKFFAYLQYNKIKKYEPYICGKFDRCIMISKEDEENLKKLSNLDNLTSIPAGVNITNTRENESQYKELRLVHIGSTEWYPNLDGLNWFLSDIYPTILKKYPKLKLHIFGNIDENKLQIVDRIRSNIVIEGFVDDLWGELDINSISIVPLRIGSGIRIKILELLAHRIPIISTSVGCEGIDVVHLKHLLVVNSTSEFIECVSNLMEQESLKIELINRGKNFIKNKYTWEIIGGRFEDVYYELLK